MTSQLQLQSQRPEDSLSCIPLPLHEAKELQEKLGQLGPHPTNLAMLMYLTPTLTISNTLNCRILLLRKVFFGVLKSVFAIHVLKVLHGRETTTMVLGATVTFPIDQRKRFCACLVLQVTSCRSKSHSVSICFLPIMHWCSVSMLRSARPVGRSRTGWSCDLPMSFGTASMGYAQRAENALVHRFDVICSGKFGSALVTGRHMADVLPGQFRV